MSFHIFISANWVTLRHPSVPLLLKDWLCVISCFQLLLNWVALCSSRCQTADHHKCRIIPTVLLLLTDVFLPHFRCSTFALWSGSVSFHIHHCHSLWWLCRLRYLSAIHLGHSVSSHGSHCHSREWLCVAPGVSLLFTGVVLHHPRCFHVPGVAPCHPRCPTAAQWGGFVSF